MIVVAAIDVPPRYRPRSARDEALRTARICYDHLAGRLGVALADERIAHGHIELSEDGGVVTPDGREFLASFGVGLTARRPTSRVFCRPCLDWSERRYHVAGFVGAALCQTCFDKGWLRRNDGTRALTITGGGQRGFQDFFGFDPTPAREEAFGT